MEYELPEEKIEEFKINYQEGNRLSDKLIIIKGEPVVKLGFWNKRKLKKAINHYNICLSLIPNHWQTNWLLAKIYQALHEHEKAFQYFKIAVEIEKSNPDLAREVSISAMGIGKIDLAISYSLKAIKRDPNDAGLICNHALNLLIGKNDQDALKWISKAIEKNPNDPINKNVLTLINDVINKKRPRPKFNELN